MNGELLDIVQMATRLRVRIVWLREEVEGGRIPAVKLDGTWWFDPSAVDAVLRSRAGVVSALDRHPVLISLATLAQESLWTVRQIRGLIEEGHIPAFRYGGRFLVEREYALAVATRLWCDRYTPAPTRRNRR